MSNRRRKNNGVQHWAYELYNLECTVTSEPGFVVLNIPIDNGILHLKFGNGDQLMNFFVLGIEEMSKVFPNHEVSKLWLDENVKPWGQD